MGWRDLLQGKDERIVLPWISGVTGRSLRSLDRTWTIVGKLPEESGWHTFKLEGRNARLGDDFDREMAKEPFVVPPGSLYFQAKGYLVGDHFVSDQARVDPDPKKIAEVAEPVYMIEPGLDRFARIEVGRAFEGGPLIYEGMDMPLGPESDVLKAYEDREVSVDKIPGVTPALDAAFRMESWQRAEAERRRAEAERRRREEEERRAQEERRQELVKKLGDGASRREMAKIDFAEAARAALAVSGAEYLDHRRAARRGEMAVRFRINRRRFECTCDEKTLQIIDAGICLTAHYDDEEFEEGTRGDTFFTLESLPSVIREAERGGRLVVFRHVD